jgi:hypothetical protein
MSPAQRLGRLAELTIERVLVEKGWDVERSTGEMPFDLIGRSPGNGPRTIQVKYTTRGRVRLESRGPNGGNKNAYRHIYQRGDFDLLGVVNGDGHIWLVPFENVEGRLSVSTKTLDEMGWRYEASRP